MHMTMCVCMPMLCVMLLANSCHSSIEYTIEVLKSEEKCRANTCACGGEGVP